MNPSPEEQNQREVEAEIEERAEHGDNDTPAEEIAGDERLNHNALPLQADFDLLPVVGLGGSAGSIGALEEFFGAMAPDAGLAYVVVVHLSPDLESQLSGILQRHTKMPVVPVAGPLKVEPNHVYVIPPGHHLAMENGHIRLEPLENEFGRRVAVDLFFRTLAASHRSRAVAVVLSGLDSDGAIGIKRVKEHGGVTVAQAPEEAQHEGMPRAAMNTGMVDWVLPVGQIAERLQLLARNEAQIQLPEAEVPARGGQLKSTEDGDEAALREILAFLQARTRHDFSHYKRATVLRRIMRRLQVNSLATLPDYLNFLRSNAGEAGALLGDLLISVTNFFRDPESFASLETHMAKLFDGKKAGDQLRVWVPGCVTGEEAYSLAMLLVKYADRLASPPSIQLFATDIDEEALRLAREGRYPQSIAADVSSERLRRFFQLDQGMYRVRSDIRDMVLFAAHNLLGDSPFSRMDLISCRNLLIYFDHQAQEKAFGVFHFALNAGGLLFLGGSESPEGSDDFAPLDKKHRLYTRRSLGQLTALPVPKAQRVPEYRTLMSATSLPPLPVSANERPALPSWGELHLHLLELASPPSVLVSADYEVLHLSPSAGKFWAFAGGSLSPNLLNLVQPSLRLELRAALFRALQNGENVDVRGLSARLDGEIRWVDVRVRPLREPDRPDGPVVYLLVVFDDRAEPLPAAQVAPVENDSVARRLDLELEEMKAYLRQTVEQYEATTEELKASNEELQAMNEELRSAGEELETSREELQATNEELLTVNAEMRSKVEQVSRANGDLQNLVSSTDIATIFLDRELRIKRYTPRSLDLFGLEPTDTGRRLSDLRNGLEIEDQAFIGDVHSVLDNLNTIEREVRTSDGRFYLLRVSPYRTQDDRIDGVVLSFVDISLRKRAEEELSASEERFRAFVTTSSDAIYRMSADWTEMRSLVGKDFVPDTNDPNSSWLETYIHPHDQPRVLEAINEAIKGKRPFDLEHRVVRVDGSLGWTHSRAIPLFDATGEISSWFGTARDITERREAEEVLREAEGRTRIAVEAAEMGTWQWDLTSNEVLWNERHFLLFGMTPHSNPVQPGELFDHVHPDDREGIRQQLQTAIEESGVFDAEFRVLLDGGGTRWMSGYGRVVETGDDGRATRLSGVMLDVTQRRQAEELLRESEERARALISNLPGGAAFIVDENERYILAEGEALETVGMQPSDFVGRTLGETVPPASLDEFRRLYRSALRGDTFELEHQVNGHWYSTRGVPLRDGGGIVAALAVSYDITERKKTEETLREREERLRLVMESVTEYAIITLDQSGTITGWNSGAERTFGWTRQEAIGQNTEIIFTPEDRERNESEKEMTEAREAGRASDERWHLRKDGSRLFMSGILSPLRNGGLHGFVKIARDLTRERETETAMRESEAQFRTLSDAVPQIIWTNEAGGVANYFNSRWFDYSGLSLEDSFGPDWQAIVHPDDAPASKERWHEALERGEIFDAEYRLRRHDGQYRWFIGRNVPLRDGDGRVTGWFGTATDINDLKEAEAALRESGEKFHAMFEQSTAGVAEYDLDGKHIFANDTYCVSLGYTCEEILQKTLGEIVYPEDWPHCHELFERTKTEPGSFTNEKRLVRKDGEILWITDSVSAIRDEAGQAQSVVTVFIDISERKRAEEELQRSHEVRVARRTRELALALALERVSAEVEQRRQAEAGRAELMKRIVNTQEEERGRISRELHDNLGQHLTAVMLGLQALESQMESFTGGRRGDSAPQLDKLRDLVDGLMRAAHRQAWELRPAELDAMGLEAALGQYIRDWSAQSSVPVDLQTVGWDDRADPAIETTLYRVVQEALTNVARHADATQVSVVLERSGNGVSAIIEDDGSGFDPESSDNGRLGLLGMRERLALVNGTLDIESEPDYGTTVFARVPAGGEIQM